MKKLTIKTSVNYRFRLLGNMSSKINLCLEMVETIPEEIEVLRWLGEPIKEFMA